MPFRELPRSFAAMLVLGVLIGFILLHFATSLSLQIILLLLSMAFVFFFSHPLAHFFTGLAFGVRTSYFFLSSSDFRKLGGSFGKIGNAIPTIGVKFDLGQSVKLSRTKRGFLFGAGAIVSNVGMLIPLLLAIHLNFGLIPLLLGMLFFFASLGTEFLFSSKVGDLSKMKRELSLA